MSYNIIAENEMEVMIAKEAIKSYRWMLSDVDKQTEFLKNKNISYGDIVTKEQTSRLENGFGILAGNPGKIVGWDFKNQYYRVYYSKNDSYVGVEERKLVKYQGSEITSDIIEYDPKIIDIMVLRF